MNFNFYIFGTPSKRYNQYPNDYTVPLMADWQSNLKGSRLVICRKMNLMYYNYGASIGNNGFIGFCIVFNGVQITRPKQLMSMFKDIIDNHLVKSGGILRYSKEGTLHYNVKSFDENILEYESIESLINTEFVTNEQRYGIQPLGAYGNDSSTVISINATDCEIVALLEMHNFVSVNDGTGADGGYLDKIISDLRQKNITATAEIQSLQTKVAKINRTKKQYFWVAVLSIAVLVSLVGLYFLNDNLSNVILNQEATIFAHEKEIVMLQDSVATSKIDIKHKVKQINLLNTTIAQYQDSIKICNRDISNLNVELSRSRTSLQSAEAMLSRIKMAIPINITSIEIGNTDYDGNIINDYGSTIYSSNTMYLQPKIYYNGVNAGSNITLKIKWYNPDGSLRTGDSSPNGYSFQMSMSVFSGVNSKVLLGWGNRTKGHWSKGVHRIEIWYNDICLKAKSITIY